MILGALVRFLAWFAVWEISKAIHYYGWLEQGIAFFLVMCIGYIIESVFYRIHGKKLRKYYNAIACLYTIESYTKVLALVVLIFISWIANLLIPSVTFTTAFQLNTLFNCVGVNVTTESKED